MTTRHIHTWQHKDAVGQVIGEIRRFVDEKGKKQDIPYYVPNATGGFGKGTTDAMKHKGNPLFGVESVTDKSKPIIICEGQKAQTAWAVLGYQCVTSILGAGNPDKSNWIPLEGVQQILLAPDNDTNGEGYIKSVAEILSAFNSPPSMQIVRLPNLPPKGDICNWLKQQPELATWNELDSLENHPAKNIIRERLDKVIAENMQPASDEWLGWEEPEEIASNVLLPVEPLLPAIIPESYREFITDTAHRMQCALDFVGVASIIATAAVVGAGCAIRPKQFDNWQVIPNLWGAIIAPPSKLKTPALNTCLDLLANLESEAKKDYEKAKSKAAADDLVHKQKLKATEDEMRSAIKSNSSIDVDAAKMRYERLMEEEPQKLTRRRFKTNDSTIEKLGEILAENPRGILVVRDELTGLLRTLEKDGHESDRAFYLESWNGSGFFTTDRIGRGTIDIENVCTSIIGGIQPDKLEEYLYQTFNGNNDGFAQRLQLAVYPDNVEWRLIDQLPNKEAKQRVLAILRSLKDMNFVSYGAVLEEGQKTPYFHFCQAAQELFNEWLTQYQRKTDAEESPIMQEHLSKYPKLMPSLALLFHLIDVADGNCSAEIGVSYVAAEKAAAWCDYLESHASRIYGLCATFEQQAISALAGKIKANKLQSPFTVRDVYRSGWHLLTDKNLALAACEELVEARWLHRSIILPARGQKQKTSYYINPKLKIEGKK